MFNRDFWGKRKVLITGHTGFKGSWLSLWLKQLGAKVNGIALDPEIYPNLFDILSLSDLVNDNRQDIRDQTNTTKFLIKIDPDIIIHMAAQPLVRKAYHNPILTYETNVMGTANVLEAARKCNSLKSIVVVTSDKCYENLETENAYVETSQLGGYDPYSSSKACTEHVASSYYRSYFMEKGVGMATVRAGNVIGGGDWSLDRLVPDAVKAFSKNNMLTIRYPKAIRPWQHVLGPLSGYITLCEHLWKRPEKFSEPWNFGPDNKSVKTVKDMADLAVKIWGGSAGWLSSKEKHPHEATFLHLNSEKAKSILGWKPIWDFNKTVSETIQWYKTYYTKKENLLEFTLAQISEYEGDSVNG